MRAVLTLNPSVPAERREIPVTVTSIPTHTIVVTIRLYQPQSAKRVLNAQEASPVWVRTA